MKETTQIALAFALSLTAASAPAAETAKPLYENHFEKAEAGKVSGDFLVLNGEFAVKEADGNKFLELPGTPLESFGVLFGPGETSGAAVSARISGTATGRRYPTFGVGLGGVSGYRLQMSPARKALELFKDQEVKASVPFDWKSGVWTLFRLQVRAVKAGEWRVEGKAWPQGNDEPKDWLVAFDEKGELITGRPSIFASPFSGTPIGFDDLAVERVGNCRLFCIALRVEKRSTLGRCWTNHATRTTPAAFQSKSEQLRK